MIIKRTSWHYRLLHWTWGERHPSSICLYFWAVFWSIALIAALVSIAAFFAVILTSPLWQFWWTPWNDRLVVAGSVIDIIVLSSIGIHFFKKMKSGSPAKEPTLVGAWIRAKKDKVCPLIEFI